MKKTASEEFVFMRDKLEKIARSLTLGEQCDLIEAAFMIGCLHSVCIQNALDFREKTVE
jgi:hypothetical protein